MRSLTSYVLFLTVVSAAFGAAANIDNHALARLKRETEGNDILANTRRIIEELVANLRKAAQQAADAMAKFAEGLKAQVNLAKQKIEEELGKLKGKVDQAVNDLGDKLSDAGSGVRDCLELQKSKAGELFNDAFAKTMSCADTKVQEVGNLISRQVEISKGGLDFANAAIEEMRNCTDSDESILIKGACLGGIALKTEMKGAVFFTQSGISVARIDIALATLPTSLELCATRRLMEAGLGTTKIIMDLGKCSASSFAANLLGASRSSPANVPVAANTY